MEANKKHIWGVIYLKKNLLNKIQNISTDRVLINEPLSKHTTFGIGGPASCFICPEREHLKKILKIAKDYSSPKSNIFINGVLDKIVKDYIKRGIVSKS